MEITWPTKDYVHIQCIMWCELSESWPCFLSSGNADIKIKTLYFPGCHSTHSCKIWIDEQMNATWHDIENIILRHVFLQNKNTLEKM